MNKNITKSLMRFDDIKALVMNILHSPDAENPTRPDGRVVSRMISQASNRGDHFNTKGKHDAKDFPLLSINLERSCPLDKGKICHHNATSPVHDLGRLDKLPNEIIWNILNHVDIPSLTRLRAVSHRAMAMVDTIPQYASVYRKCPDVIRAAVSIEANFSSCEQLYETLRSDQCSDCGSFGDFVYLIDCRRVCSLCSITNLHYCPLTTMRAAKHITLTPDQEREGCTKREILLQSSLPRILGLPTKYDTAEVQPGDLVAPASVPQRILFFDRKAVMLGRSTADRWHSELVPKALALARVRAPKIFKRGLGADWGNSCLGCVSIIDFPSDESFTRARLLEHLKKMGPVLLNDDNSAGITDASVRKAVTRKHLSDLRRWDGHGEVLSCLRDSLMDLIYHQD